MLLYEKKYNDPEDAVFENCNNSYIILVNLLSFLV